VWECLHISALMERAGEFDLIHNHYDFLPLTYSRLIPTPMLTTIHGFSSTDIIPVYKEYNNTGHYVSISNSDRSKELRYIATIYNGIDESLFPYREVPEEYLLSFGRIHPEKGAHLAIEIARKLNMQLIICGLIQDARYFAEKVEPFVDGDNVIYKGNVGPADRRILLGNAKALLHPVLFEEPFGLSVAEAMMCGTPVIAFNRGSMKELIVEGKTGFLVDTVEEAVAVAGDIEHIHRYDCHRHAITNFSQEQMVNRYIEVYKRIVSTA